MTVGQSGVLSTMCVPVTEGAQVAGEWFGSLSVRVRGAVGQVKGSPREAYKGILRLLVDSSFYITTSASFLNMASRCPASVSDEPLPDDIYQLPPNMQPQPSLTRFWCQACIVALSTSCTGFHG